MNIDATKRSQSAQFAPEPLEQHQRDIQRHWTTIGDGLDPRDVISNLFSEAVIDTREKAEILAVGVTHQQTEKLLNVLFLKDATAYDTFLKILAKTGHGYLLARIQGGHSRSIILSYYSKYLLK